MNFKRAHFFCKNIPGENAYNNTLSLSEIIVTPMPFSGSGDTSVSLPHSET